MMKEFDDNIPARAFDNFQASGFGLCLFLELIWFSIVFWSMLS